MTGLTVEEVNVHVQGVNTEVIKQEEVEETPNQVENEEGNE